MTQTSTTYEYGAMSSRFSLEAENKLTAYATMCLHYNGNYSLIALYAPQECKDDQWLSFGGPNEKLESLFGGHGKMEEYIEQNIEAIKACYNTIKRLV
ncbi:hypothetical protein F0L74_09995 [Chitinophaga agrisoli]|uniref:Uncharacterized protein n=1 Tax=Chitinophaga agrisoli TaxID=2607653 RepID=A0A5B2VW31_9BACT|nr:hypothetical protein [Chitinophaga agrisoli]KAA2242850.1 hypothetical protein F0L74_09995 [Chitinophaga agrisoli]